MMNHLDIPIEWKAGGSESAGIFSGLASTYGVDLGGDRIEPGAFRRTLAEHAAKGTRPALLAHHDHRRPIGVWTRIEETPKGLEVDGKLTIGVRDADEAHALLKAGALGGLSIGYATRKERFDGKVRVLQDVDLFEVSLVSVPMNPGARVAVVKAAETIRTRREYENWLIDFGGFSSRKAKTLAAAFIDQHSNEQDELADLARMIRGKAAIIKG